MKKRLISLFLSLALTFSLIPISAIAAEEVYQGDYLAYDSIETYTIAVPSADLVANGFYHFVAQGGYEVFVSELVESRGFETSDARFAYQDLNYDGTKELIVDVLSTFGWYTDIVFSCASPSGKIEFWGAVYTYSPIRYSYDQNNIQYEYTNDGSSATFQIDSSGITNVQMGSGSGKYRSLSWMNKDNMLELLYSNGVTGPCDDYVSVVERVMQTYGYSELSAFEQDQYLGMLFDCDADGQNELVLEYPQDYSWVYQIWTMRNGQAVNVMHAIVDTDSRGVIYLASNELDRYVVISGMVTGSEWANETWDYYLFSGERYELEYELLRSENYRGSEPPGYSINEKEATKSEFDEILAYLDDATQIPLDTEGLRLDKLIDYLIEQENKKKYRMVIAPDNQTHVLEVGQALHIECVLYYEEALVEDWEGPQLSIGHNGDDCPVSYEGWEETGSGSYGLSLEGVTPGTAYLTIDEPISGNSVNITVDVIATSEELPSGYNFNDDSYNFPNFSVSTISKKYFTTMYGPAAGKLLYQSNKKMADGGICFGMATTTCAIYNGYPDCTSFTTEHLLSGDEICNRIRDLEKNSVMYINNNKISLLDYLKYAHIYQLSSAVAQSSNSTWGDIDGLLAAIRHSLSEETIGVTVGLIHCVLRDGEWEADSGHRVLAVGLDGNDILIDDPNSTDGLERITINEDGTWTYSKPWSNDGINSENSLIRYQTDYAEPYLILSTGRTVTSSSVTNGNEEVTESYIEGIEYLDGDELLISIESSDYTLNNNDTFKIMVDAASDTANEDIADYYWIGSENTVYVSALSATDSTISIAANDTLMTAAIESEGDIAMTLGDDDAGLVLSLNAMEEFELSFNTFSKNGNDVVLTISGTASNGEVSAFQTDSGVHINGVSDGTVTLEQDEQIVYVGDIEGDDQDVDVIYDITGENDDLIISSTRSNIYRIAGNDRCATAREVADELKEILGVESFDAIIIANGDNFADALAGSYLAAVKSAPILLHRNSGAGDDLNETYVKENLSDGGTIYLLGGTTAIPESIEDKLISLHFNVVRLAGDNRFDTNLKILEEAGIYSGEEILVTTGWNFADCLSASATGKPILMLNTTTNMLTSAQETFLENHRDNQFTIIGGTAAVNKDLENMVSGIVTKEIVRISGDTREETSVKVAQRYFDDPDVVFVAYSRNFPDGLCGGPLAHAMKAPLLLVNKGQEASSRDYISENSIFSGYILGGSSAVSDETAMIIFEDLEKPRQVTWKEFNAGSSYDGAGELTGFLLQGMFTCSPDVHEGFTATNEFGAEQAHKPFYVDGDGYEYMYFSFWIPNDPTLEGWQRVTLYYDGTSQSVEVYLHYLGDYSHIVGTPESVAELGWEVTQWRVIS